MNRTPSDKMRELLDNEMAAVSGGVIGAIPGGFKVQLPSSLFVSGYSCISASFGGQFMGGSCNNTY